MNKELESLKQVNELINKVEEYKNKTGKDNPTVSMSLKLLISIQNAIQPALQRLESIDNANPSEALKKLEMLSDCAEAMKEAPSSNWVEYANSENELDLKLWMAYEDLKDYILKSQEQEKMFKIIKERQVNFSLLMISNNVEDYNFYIPYVEHKRCLTKEEFDLLKRWANEQD